MKKSLLALAALSAIAGTAQAQSSVTLFGLLDEGAYYANKVSATPSNTQAWGVLANTVATSNWGLKGTEDLGGGTKANFYLESGFNASTGTLANTSAASGTTNTLFDRGAYAGLEGKWGKVDVGNRVSPFFATVGGTLPVSGNSVAVNAASNGGYFLPFVHNSITYSAPSVAGFNGAVQYGSGNQLNSSAGTVINAAGTYDVGGLNLRAAYQYLSRNGSQLSANNINAVASSTTVTSLSPQVQTYALGAKYTAGAFTVGTGFVANAVDYVGVTGAPTSVSGANGRKYNLNQYQLGVGYQATPAVLLGLSWVGATSGSNLINAQARYAFSKRTQAYGQIGYAINKTGLNGSGLGNMTAIAGANGSTVGQGVTVASPTFNQFAFGVGVMHTF